MSRPLSIYTYVPQRYHAGSYYRLLVPLETARDMGLNVQIRIDSDQAAITPEMHIRAFCEADVAVLYQPIGDQTLFNFRQAKSIMPSKVNGDWKYPPSLVVDSDDNIFNVNPHNGAYRTLGYRDHEGKEIPPGSLIGCIQAGEKRVLWRDGENGFDISRNRHTLATYRDMAEMADAFTCTTPRVAEATSGDANLRRTFVSPNMVRFDHYPQISIAKDPKRIDIMWQGGGAHYEDWYPLRDAMGEITRKYPEVHWTIWGVLYQWVAELIPPDRYTYEPWCDYREYKLRLVMKAPDINLAPLADTRFNRCRSAIKFYEGAVLKHPAPTLAQDTGPYKDEIIDGRTGMLFSNPEEFVAKLSFLIENERERKVLGENAKDWVSENRDAFKLTPKLIGFYESLREAAKRETPHMPESDWDDFMAEVEASEAHENGAVQPVA